MCVIYYSTQILLILLFKYCRGSKHRRFCTLVLENNVNYVAWGGEEVPEKNELTVLNIMLVAIHLATTSLMYTF